MRTDFKIILNRSCVPVQIKAYEILVVFYQAYAVVNQPYKPRPVLFKRAYTTPCPSGCVILRVLFSIYFPIKFFKYPLAALTDGQTVFGISPFHSNGTSHVTTPPWFLQHTLCMHEQIVREPRLSFGVAPHPPISQEGKHLKNLSVNIAYRL